MFHYYQSGSGRPWLRILSHLRAWSLFIPLTHDLRPFGTLRAGSALHSVAAPRLRASPRERYHLRRTFAEYVSKHCGILTLFSHLLIDWIRASPDSPRNHITVQQTKT
jgi:hypothetical protein